MLLTSSKKGVSAPRYSKPTKRKPSRKYTQPSRHGSKTIRISERAYQYINKIGTFGESYNDVIKRILDKVEE